MKAPSPSFIIRSILSPEQADALLRTGITPNVLARGLVEAGSPADLAGALRESGLEKAEPLPVKMVAAIQGLLLLNQERADRAVRAAALAKAMLSKATMDKDFAASGGRFLARKYGLKPDEAMALVRHPNQKAIIDGHETWREKNGFPAPDSPLSRGKLLSAIKVTK